MRRKNILLLLTLTTLLLLMAGNAGAMFSANYRLDWFAPLTGGGGGQVYSTNYVANTTIGQAVTGAGSSTNYEAGLGYWYGMVKQNILYLPLETRN